MLDLPKIVTRPVALSLTVEAGSADVDAELRYDTADPFAVTLVIGSECDEQVPWTFARELLQSGVTTPSGLGDVFVEPADLVDGPDLVRITLANGLMATMTISRSQVIEFLCSTYDLVPTGAEMDHIDIDEALATLLA